MLQLLVLLLLRTVRTILTAAAVAATTNITYVRTSNTLPQQTTYYSYCYHAILNWAALDSEIV